MAGTAARDRLPADPRLSAGVRGSRDASVPSALVSRRPTTAEQCKEEVEERTEELEGRIDAHADALPVRFESPRLGDLSSAAQTRRLSPFGHPLMMFPALRMGNVGIGERGAQEGTC